MVQLILFFVKIYESSATKFLWKIENFDHLVSEIPRNEDRLFKLAFLELSASHSIFFRDIYKFFNIFVRWNTNFSKLFI